MDIYGIKDFPEVKIGGKIKSQAEDFIVEEITPSGKVCSVKTNLFEKLIDFLPKNREEQVYFTLIKKNYTTQRAIRHIAEKLRISLKRFGYGGIKDKKALTAQKISVWNQKISDVKKVKLKDLQLKNFEYSKKRMTLGNLQANRFTIIIREVPIPISEVKKRINLFKKEYLKKIPNYFGPQRFGRQRPVNQMIGKNLLRGNFEEAVKILISAPGNEGEDGKNARKFAADNWGNWSEILKVWPRHLGIEAAILNYLVKYPTDYANAFRKLPKNLRRLFIHSYQSYIYNIILTKILESGKDLPEAVDLVGYETELDELTSEILKKEEMDKEMFRLKRMPELSEAGEKRNTTIRVENFKIISIKRGLIKLQFTLGKGSYATVLLKMLLGDYTE